VDFAPHHGGEKYLTWEEMAKPHLPKTGKRGRSNAISNKDGKRKRKKENRGKFKYEKAEVLSTSEIRKTKRKKSRTPKISGGEGGAARGGTALST